MPKSNSALGQVPASIPADEDEPNVNGDMAALINAIERRLLMSWPDRATRTTAITAPHNGMRTYIENVHEIDERINGQWVKVWPTTYSGTTVPSPGLGVVGDVYFQLPA